MGVDWYVLLVVLMMRMLLLSPMLSSAAADSKAKVKCGSWTGRGMREMFIFFILFIILLHYKLLYFKFIINHSLCLILIKYFTVNFKLKNIMSCDSSTDIELIHLLGTC